MNNQDEICSATLLKLRKKIASVQEFLAINTLQPATVLGPVLPREKAAVDLDILIACSLARNRAEFRSRLNGLIKRLREEEDLLSQSVNESTEKLSEHVGESMQELVTQIKLLEVTTTSVGESLVDLTTKVEQIGSDVSSCDRRLQKMDNEPQNNTRKKDKGSKKLDIDQDRKNMAKLELVLQRIMFLKSILFAGSSEEHFKEPKDLAKCAAAMDEDILLIWCRASTKEAYCAGLCDLYERLRQEKNDLKECLGITDNLVGDGSSSNKC